MVQQYTQRMATKYNCSYNYKMSTFSSFNRQIVSASHSIYSISKIEYSRIELDLHVASIVTGANCCIMRYTGRICDVSPYRDDYLSINNVPIVKAPTAYQSPHMEQVYTLIFNETIWMYDSLKHMLINPNQIRHSGDNIQDNPTSNELMFVTFQ